MSERRFYTGLAVVLVLVTLVFLYVDLDSTRARLRDEQAAHQSTLESLQAARAAVDDVNAGLVSQSQAIIPLQRDAQDVRRRNAALQADRDALEGYLNTAIHENSTLFDQLAASRDARAALNVELAEAEARITTLEMENAEITGQLEEMTRWFESRNDDYNTLSQQLRRLQEATRTLEQLETRAGELRTEIAELEELRRPLFLAMQRRQVEGFLCTGSMEPKLTCLDTATWMRDFTPDEIVVGSIITFDNRACWSDATGGRSAHRVVDVRVIDGVHHYWPKGDAHDHPDGCWVRETAVYGYMTEIHPNTVPANAELRDNVNAARSAYDTAWESYLDAIELNCGHREPQRCSVSLETALGRQAQSLWLIAEAASNHYSCWYANATASQYPGHIPYDC